MGQLFGQKHVILDNPALDGSCLAQPQQAFLEYSMV
jgi:hypothetical protein